jgi:murein DD-endopeptidase MepM/ murein hydrolase activator NlpD
LDPQLTRKPFAILSLSAAAIGGALLSGGVASAAPAPTAAAQITADTPSSYTVQPGDTLWAIGQRYGISEDSLAAANGMNLDDVLEVGRTLTLTGSSAAPAASQSSSTPAASSSSSSSGSYAPGSSLEQCIINSESGGNPQVTNSSGHWGLYQFSQSTWEAYGGSASSFGSASPAQQQQVFDNAINSGGASNWTAYDGC